VTQYQTVTTARFRKDFRRLHRAGFDISKLDKIIALLRQGQPLPPHARDHALHGNLRDFRACHIEPDWILLYEKRTNELILVLVSTGDHRRTLGIE